MITPSSLSLPVSGKQPFVATVINSNQRAVTWRVLEGVAGGTITPGGVYTAPPTAGTFHLVATSQSDPSLNATAAVVVHLVLSISPTTATVTLASSQQFTSTVIGAANNSVVWSLVEGASGGTISVVGLYTAPKGATGSFRVRAVSVADPTQVAYSTVLVQAGGATGTIQ